MKNFIYGFIIKGILVYLFPRSDDVVIDMASRNRSDDTLSLTTPLFFLVALVALGISTVVLTTAASNSFSSSAVITSTAPTVVVNLGQTITGATGTTATVYLYFNASDDNGWGDLNDSTATVVINKTGKTSRTSSSCAVLSHPNAKTTSYNCSLVLYYYDASGTWSINASVSDNSTNYAQNTTITLSVSTIDAVSPVSASISFTGVVGTNDVASSPTPQRLNNTGNQNYNTVNITGYSFLYATNVIGVGNVTMNVSASGGQGQSLLNGTPVTLTRASLSKGAVSLQNVSFYLDVPDTMPSGTYNAQSSRQIQVY